MENEIVFKLLDSLVHTEKNIVWERTPISNVYRCKIGNKYIEIEKSEQYSGHYYLRIFDSDSFSNLATYSTHKMMEHFNLFKQVYKDAYNSVEHGNDDVIKEIIKYLNS